MSGMLRWDEADLQRHMAKVGKHVSASPVQQVAVAIAKAEKARTPRKQPSQGIVFQCKALGLPVPVSEFKFHESRRFAFDFAWPDLRIALEIEGIVYPTKKGDYGVGGRHGSVAGFTRDITKYGESFARGWRVLRCLPSQIDNGTAIKWLEPVLRGIESA